MKFGYTILYVPDVAQALAFYERAFGLRRRFIHESGDYAELETGATTLAFASTDLAATNFGERVAPADPDGPAAPMEIAFVTDEVDHAFAQATRAGAVPLSAPEQKPWGQTVAYVRDLNGMIVELCTPVRA